jgi:hypothetical protein
MEYFGILKFWLLATGTWPQVYSQEGGIFYCQVLSGYGVSLCGLDDVKHGVVEQIPMGLSVDTGMNICFPSILGLKSSRRLGVGKDVNYCCMGC